MIKHLNIQITGEVQGVGFRYHTQAEAERLGLGGYVQNTEEGHVIIEIEGEPSALEAFTSWCANGPDKANVSQVHTSEGKLQDYRSFEIRK